MGSTSLATDAGSRIRPRPRGRTACLAGLITTCLALVALLALPSTAPARVQTFKAAKVKRGIATFRLKGVFAGEIRAARVVGPRGTKRVPVGRVRRGIRRGYLRVRIARARHAGSRAHDARRKR